MHYSRKCRCIISILTLSPSGYVAANEILIEPCPCTARVWTKFDSFGFVFPLNGRQRGGNWNGNWNGNGNVVSKRLTHECNFIGKCKKTKKQTRTKLESTFVWFSTPANCLIYLGRAVWPYTPFMEHWLLEFIQQLLEFMGASDLQHLIFSHPQTSFQRMKRRHLHSTSRH